MISVTTFGHATIFLNSAQAVNDLLVARGANYSSRPNMPMIVDLLVPIILSLECGLY